MRKLFWSLLICPLLTGSYVNAVELLSDEPGEMLIFPFFTTQKGWDTYLNIATFRTDPFRIPVFKVRILEPEHGEVVARFNVYPYHHENWRVSISHREAEGALLRVEEGSCLVQGDLEAVGQGSAVNLPVRVGMIEVYALGELDTLIEGHGSELSACEEIADRWNSGGIWDMDPQEDLITIYHDTDRRWLLGELYLVNVEEGLAATYSPVVLQNVTEIRHTAPGSESPNLAEADPVAVVNGEEKEPKSGEGIDAVAMVLAQDNPFLVNDVITDGSIAARTDWVVSYPLNTYKNYKPDTVMIDGEERFCESFGNENPEPGDATVVAPLNWNHTWTWGQQETNYVNDPGFDPQPPGDFVAAFCQAVNVVAFGGKPPILVEDDSVFLSPAPDPIQPDPAQGASFSMRWGPYPAIFPEGSDVLRPVLGFRMTTFQNGKLDGESTLANYAVIRSHVRR